MSLSTYYLEYGSHLARLHRRRRRRRRRRAYAPTSNTASHDTHEKINSWVSFCFPYEYGAPLLAALRAAGAPLLLFFPCNPYISTVATSEYYCMYGDAHLLSSLATYGQVNMLQ